MVREATKTPAVCSGASGGAAARGWRNLAAPTAKPATILLMLGLVTSTGCRPAQANRMVMVTRGDQALVLPGQTPTPSSVTVRPQGEDSQDGSLRLVVVPSGDDGREAIFSLAHSGHTTPDPEQLAALLAAYRSASPTETSAVIVVDTAVQWRRVVDAYNQLAKAGFTDIEFAAKD